MEEIEFQAVVEGDTIRVPEQYRQLLTKIVKVTIEPLCEGKIQYAPRGGPGQLTPDDFSTLKIDTTSWKFNREEANERR